MYLKRNIDQSLLEWKNDPEHKPLLLRGARQVGKSSSIRNLGLSFDDLVEINFEREPERCALFEKIRNVHELVSRIELLYGKKIVPGKSLLFLDEIQACPAAIRSLWFFKEDFPELHVIAAGSLLEFALQELTSFGVGRISSMFIYPLSFDEFLSASGHEQWLAAKKNASPAEPLFDELHEALVEQFRTFLIVGGMPVCVAKWVTSHNYRACAVEQEEIQQSYYDDFVKYKGRHDPQLLRNVLQSVVKQNGQKFIYSKVEGNWRTDEVKMALQMLVDAGIIYRVSHSAANGLPLGAETNDKFRKYIYMDSGLLLRILHVEFNEGNDITEAILSELADELINKGAMAELFAGTEMVKYHSSRSKPELFYWENLDKGCTAEVDYLLGRNMCVLPVEIKSGRSGKMKSLNLFMNKKALKHGIRCSLENFSTITTVDGNEISILPLYALSNL